MNVNIPKSLVILLSLSGIGCSSPSSHLSYSTQPTRFNQAARVPDPVKPPAVVIVPKVMPMLGQLKPLEKLGSGAKVEKGTKMGGMEKLEFGKAPESKLVGEILDEGNHRARIKPGEDHFFNAITQYDYERGALYQIYTAPKHITDIVLAPGEVLTGKPAGGDTVRWEVGVTSSGEHNHKRVHVLVKPVRPNLKTNLTLHTNRRTYLLELRAFRSSYMASVSWHYPQETIKQLTLAAAERDHQASGVVQEWATPMDLHFDYRVKTVKGKSPSWIPRRVFDDGRKTYIQFPSDIAVRESPALFLLSAEKKIQLVNYRMKGTYYIVDRLFETAELRLGEKTQTVVRIQRKSVRSHSMKRR